jgi:Cellulase (glycosyl hydrolase family 5)
MSLSFRTLLLPLVLALAALALVPSAGHASAQQFMTFEAPNELLDDGTRDQTLDEIRQFGVTHIRQLVYWKSYAPHPNSKRKPNFKAWDPNAYPAGTWDRLDRLVAGASGRGIQVMLTLTGPVPKWATSTKKDYVTRPNARFFQQFAAAVGKRYGGQVSMWSVWNEPNQPQFLMPQYRKGAPASPGIYRSLYQAAVKGIRSSAQNKRDAILVGETSPRGNQHIVAPLRFLRGMLCLNSAYHKTRKCGKLDTQGYAHHAYTTRTGPRFVPPKDDVTIGVLSRLNAALYKAGRAGAIPRGLKIYLTEFGIQTTPDEISGVSFAKQAAYRSIAEHIAYANPKVAMFSQYLMRDDKPRKTGYRYGGFETGLRRSDGRKKPSYESFRLPLAVESYGRNDVVWGFVRPMRATTHALVQVRGSGKGAKWRKLRNVTTTSTGVYGFTSRHRKGQTYRVRWTAPNGTTYTGPAISAY